MISKQIQYKGISFIENSELNYLEFIVDNENFSDIISYIPSISIVLEYALKMKPEYIIVNRLNSNFTFSPEMTDFTLNHIFHPLQEAEIKKFCIVVKEENYNKTYKGIDKIIPFMKAFLSLEEAYEWIRAERNA